MRSPVFSSKNLTTLTEKLSLCEYLMKMPRIFCELLKVFTVIVRYIFTSCREYLANNVDLTKKYSLNVSRLGMSVTTQGGSGRQFVTGP